jgi:ribosomal subunit interface protein
MSIVITGKNIEVGEALKAHIEDLVRGVAGRYFSNDVIESHVILSKETHLFLVDLSVHVSKHFIVRTHGEDNDAHHAVSLAIEKMENRIKKYKSRLRDSKRHISREDLLPAQQYIVNTEEDKGEDTPVIIAEMSSEIPTLSVSEAVMRMDLGEAPVLMFKNAKHGQLNVVYKRSDGNIGWIDPSIQK